MVIRAATGVGRESKGGVSIGTSSTSGAFHPTPVTKLLPRRKVRLRAVGPGFSASPTRTALSSYRAHSQRLTHLVLHRLCAGAHVPCEAVRFSAQLGVSESRGLIECLSASRSEELRTLPHATIMS